MVNEDVFRKVKARVGKRAKAQANETDVSFRKAGLHVAEQKRVSQKSKKGTFSSDRGLTITQLAHQLKHPASAVRVSSIKGFQNLLVDHQVSDHQCEEMVRAYIGPASVVDTSATVREEGFGLLQKLPFASFSSALILSALNSLDPRQAIHAAKVLDWLLQSNHDLNIGSNMLDSNLIPSLTRLLIPFTNRNAKSGGVLSSSRESTEYDAQETKSKKRKLDDQNSDRIVVLKAIRSVLSGCVGSSSPSTKGKRRKLRILRDMSVWAELANDRLQMSACVQKDLESLLTKLRDVLLEENMSDFAVAADCFRSALGCMDSCQSEIASKLCQQVSKVAYINNSTLLLLALARGNNGDTDKIMKAVIREVCRPTTDDETFLIVVSSILQHEGGLSEEMRNRMSERFFATKMSDQDMRSKWHRQAIRLICTSQVSIHTEEFAIRLPAFLVAWEADFLEDSKGCLDWMTQVTMKNCEAPTSQQWGSGLEALFEQILFASLPDALQHSLICLVTNLGNPTSRMIHHWSTWISQHDVGESHMSLMLQCMHAMRHSLSVRTYLGFLIDSMGLLGGLATESSIGNDGKITAKIEDICWAIHQIGVSKVVPKLGGVLSSLLSDGKLKSVATLLKCFSRDLSEDQSIVKIIPESIFDLITKELHSYLSKSDEEIANDHPLLEFFRLDLIALRIFMESLPLELEKAGDEHVRFLETLFREMILPQLSRNDRTSDQVLQEYQKLCQPSSKQWLKVEGLRQSRGFQT